MSSAFWLGPELDDAKVGEAMPVERIFLDDGFDLLPGITHSQDDPASRGIFRPETRKLPAALLQETDVSRHVRIDFLEAGFVDELDDEHGRQPASKAPPGGPGVGGAGQLALLRQECGQPVRKV